MNKRLVMFALLVSVVTPATAGARSAAYGVAIRGATVNGDHSVTIAWERESANAANTSIVVDGAVVGALSGGATIFKTRPLPGGWHTITVEVREIFEAYTPPSGATCEVSGGHWLCVRSWLSSIGVSVPVSATTCVVPRLVGLRLVVAKARIMDTRCAIGALAHVHSKRRAGTVLTQRPKPTRRQLPAGTAIRLVVSSGRR
jgi:hypothetical protein